MSFLRIIANTGFQDGVGRSTTTAVLAFMLMRHQGLKPLIIDLDSKNSQRMFFQDLKDAQLDYSTEIGNAKLQINRGRIADLATVGYSLTNQPPIVNTKIFKLKRYLKSLNYDIILIDTPSTFDTSCMLGFQLADDLNIVCTSGIEGLDQVENVLDKLNTLVKDSVLSPSFSTITLNGKDVATYKTDFSYKIKKYYRDFTFQTILKRRKPIHDYASKGITERYVNDRKALKDYKELTAEFSKHYKLEHKQGIFKDKTYTEILKGTT